MITLLVLFPLLGCVGAAFLARHILKIERHHHSWSFGHEVAELLHIASPHHEETAGSFN